MTQPATRLGSTVEIAAAFVAQNKLDYDRVADLVVSIFVSLGGDDTSESVSEPQGTGRPTPAMIRKSVGAEALISFEDGKSYRMLKRHLSSRELTPDAYRTKWGLPADYPMVAPAYRSARSEIARRIGLGRTTRRPADKMAGGKNGRTVTSTIQEAGADKRAARKPGADLARPNDAKSAKAAVLAQPSRGRAAKAAPLGTPVGKSAKSRTKPTTGNGMAKPTALKNLAGPTTKARAGNAKAGKPKRVR